MIGAGFIADYHLGGLSAAGGAQVVALYGRTPASTAALAAKYAIGAVMDDWRALLDRRDIDAVIVTTPDHTHRDIAVAAAEAGKAVLLQKPMARSGTECAEIIAAARRARTLLAVSFMHRYFEEVRLLADWLGERRLGRLFSVRMRNATPGPDWKAWFFSRANVGGGVVLQLGVHGIDLLRHLFGPITAVSGDTAIRCTSRTLADGTVVHPDNEDHACALYRFGEHLTATHEMSFAELAGCDRFTLELYAERGSVWLRSVRGAFAAWAPEVTGRREWVVPELPATAYGERHHRHFLDMVRGRLPADGSDRDGLATLAVAETLYRSARSRQEEAVAVPEIAG